MKEIIYVMVGNKHLHAKWLNTLSFMENAGARKISVCEDETMVDIVQLKHAAEEHRHAYYLKKQILKLGTASCSHYEPSELIAPIYTRQYLHRLDMACSRYLKHTFGLEGKELRFAAYIFVTYAIEVRADELYPIYQEVLTEKQSKVMVKSIIMEEEGHLEEMTAMLENFHQNWQQHASEILQIEKQLFDAWWDAVSKEVICYGSTEGALA